MRFSLLSCKNRATISIDDVVCNTKQEAVDFFKTKHPHIPLDNDGYFRDNDGDGSDIKMFDGHTTYCVAEVHGS